MRIFKKMVIILSLGILVGACQTTKSVKREDFTVNMKSPQSTIGEIELQMDTMMGIGPIKKQSVTVLYFPKEDVVCLRYKYEFYTYNQFWDKRSRLIFISALQKYNKDYDDRNLQRKSKTAQKEYGTVRGYLVWQQLAFTVQARANMNIDLGYTFNDKSPYFTILQGEAVYTDSESRDNSRTSTPKTMYFTRAQAAELAEIFEQHTIIDINLPDDYEEPPPPPAKKDDVPRDIY
jgi:hypothetical protein